MGGNAGFGHCLTVSGFSRNEARFMFSHGFDNYMQKAFPKDDLRPISCRGTNSQGGIALSLVDALDTLIVRQTIHPYCPSPARPLLLLICRGASRIGLWLCRVPQLLGEQHEVRRAVHWLRDNLSFDVDERVHVFELTIRALGGLLSAHVLLLRDPNLVPE